MKPLALIFLVLIVAGPALADTVLAGRNIRAQAIIGPDDIVMAEADTPGTYVAPEEVIGLEARKVLYAGRPIRIEDLGEPAIIDRNQIVTLVYQVAGLVVAAEGRALGRAGVGDRLRVMNLASRQVISGTVREDGSVDLSPVTVPLISKDVPR